MQLEKDSKAALVIKSEHTQIYFICPSRSSRLWKVENLSAAS